LATVIGNDETVVNGIGKRQEKRVHALRLHFLGQ
jgi:hypothetical protein